ncbi:serine/threonine-protein kinase [Streptomyces sp. NPDC005774]|uniref:serine/threonine-protein kinase n=1 Tax=Streptomyces sp. NPDC005774 TaxID=3364728 RepID=UPI0036D04599
MHSEDRADGADGGVAGPSDDRGADDGAAGGSDGRWADDGLQRADTGAPQEWPGTPPHGDQPFSPTVIDGRYELLVRIGEGGMGEVWKAYDRRLHRFVAVKGLLDRKAMTAGTRTEAMRRARREAEAIAKIEHRNVVTVHDQVETDDQVWIVMKLFEARSLAKLLSSERVLAVPRAADIGLQILQGLRAVHGASVVHRDVKPGNVVVRDDGLAILVDFGIATFDGAPRVTRTGNVIGTFLYQAPELFAPASPGPTPASDLWALGITLYEMVEGHVPFDGNKPWEVQENIRQSPEPSLQYAGPLSPVIRGLLITDPRQRLDAASAEAMLREVIEGPAPAPVPAASVPAEPVPAEPVPAPPSASGKRVRSPGWKAATAAAVCVALLAGVGWIVSNGGPPDDKSGDRAGSGQAQDSGESGTQQRWKDTHTILKIGVKGDQPGLSLYDEKTKTYEGYDIDLAYAIAESMGYAKPRFTQVPTDYRSTALKTKKVDLIIASYSITDERKNAAPGEYSVAFAGPYYEASRSFLVREKSTRYKIKDSSDLKDLGVAVCTARDSTYEKTLPEQGFTMAKSQPNTYQDCLDKLLDEKSDVYAVASDDIILAGYLKANPGKVRLLENIQGAEGYGVAMRPENKLLKREVCSALRTVLAGKTWDEMYVKNLSDLMDDKAPPGRPDLTECENH